MQVGVVACPQADEDDISRILGSTKLFLIIYHNLEI